MATKIQVRRDTAANWTSANTVLSSGEMGYETDTGYMKIGDGTTNWSSLSYFTPGDVSDDNTTYTISVAQSGGDANVTLTGSDASNDTVTMVAGNNLTVTVAGDNVTMDVDNDLANYSNATSQFLTDITAQAIGSLTDVNVSAVADGSVLAYDQGSGNWVAGDPAVGALDDLSDVTLGTPSTGNLLHYNGANWEASSSPMSTLNLGTLRVSGTTGQDYTSFGTLTGTDGGIITHAGNVTAGAMWYHADTDYDFVANFDSVFLNASESCKLTIIINNDQEGRDTICTGIQFNGFDKLDVQWASGAAPTVGTLGGYDIIEFTVVNNATNSLSNLGETDIQDNVYVFADHKANVSQSLAGLSDVDVYALFPSSSEPVSGSFLTYDTVENKWEASQGFLPKIYMDRGSFVNRQGFLYNVGFYDEENILTGTDGDVLEFNLDTDDVDNRIKSAGIYYIESIDYNFIANFDRAAYDGNVSYNANTRSKGQKNFRLIVDNRSRSQTRIQGSSKQSTIFTTGLTIVLNGVTVTNSGGTLGQFVEDINTAAIPNVRAFNQNSYIHLVGDGVDIEIDAASTGLAELFLTAGTYTQTVYGSGEKGPIGYQMKGKSLDVKYHNGVAPTPKAGEVNVYDIEIVEDQSFNGDPEYKFAFVRHWNESADIVGGVFTGDLKGSVAADDSTVLIDGTEGTFNLDGTIAGNLTVDNGNIKVAGPNGYIIEKAVSGNSETLGKITATNGSVEYGEIEFKTGPDSYVNNSEINWYARIGGVKTPIFEIKGTSLGKSGFELNPSAATDVDFSMQGSTDPVLIFADSGDDRVGFGKIPTQGKVDVNGDVYADNLNGTVVATFNLGASGTDHYVFSDSDNHWFPTSENDPTLYLRRGETYVFNNTSGSHPFQIQSVAGSGGAAYSTGVTNNNTVGVVTFKVPMSAPATLYYQCTSHANMGGTMNII
jgi:hypothetical protein